MNGADFERELYLLLAFSFFFFLLLAFACAFRSIATQVFEVDTGPQGQFEAKFLRSTQARRANLRLDF